MSFNLPLALSLSKGRTYLPLLEREGRSLDKLGTNGGVLLPRLLLDLGRIEQSRDDCGRADAYRDTGLDQFRAPLLVGAVDVVVGVGHQRLSMASGAL